MPYDVSGFKIKVMKSAASFYSPNEIKERVSNILSLKTSQLSYPNTAEFTGNYSDPLLKDPSLQVIQYLNFYK